jgi:peptide/nickel transport system substrate-binding protein
MQQHGGWRYRPQGRISRRRALGLALAGSGAAAFSAACKPRRATSTTGQGSAAKGAQPRPGGGLNLVEFNDFFDFDPTFQGSSAPNWDATMLGYDTLLDFDRAANLNFADITVKPRLIERWETPDAKIFTLHVRPDVHFADAAPVNGRALTSADVKWTLEYLSRTGAFTKLPPASYSFALSGLESVQAPDPATVVVQFSDPYAPFLNYLTTCTMPVLPHEIFDQDGNFRSRMVGTGPYQLDTSSTQKGSQWVFKRNPSYWMQGDRYLDRVRYLVLPDTASQLAAFRAGQVDLLVVTADPRAAATVRQSNPAAAVQQSVNPLPEQMLLNSRRAPLGDVRVRQAISLSIDRDEFDKVMNGDIVGWTPGMWAQDEVRKASKFDPNQAKSLLTAAGFGGGVTIPFLVADSDDKTPVQLLQSQLKRSGIDLQLEIVDKATRSARTNKNDFTTFFGGKPFGDPDSWLYSFNYSTGPSNRAGVKDSKLDALILAQRREMDPAKRKDLIKQASVYIVENAYDIAVHATARWDFWQPYVKNYSAHWVQNDSNAREVWLAK